jgi:protein involved in polysaccharide export with SLBB domain
MQRLLKQAAQAVRQYGLLGLTALLVLGGGLGSAMANVPNPPEAAVAPNTLGLSSYPLGSGDVITIRVFGEDDLTLEKIRLTDAGTIFYPVVGEFRVLGLTLGELERAIDERLRGRILVNPRVSVEINEYRPFYINGMVHRPGAYPFQPGLTVRKAASLAGGFRERASRSRIFLIQAQDATKTPQRVVLDTPMGPGDILTIEESFF